MHHDPKKLGGGKGLFGVQGLQPVTEPNLKAGTEAEAVGEHCLQACLVCGPTQYKATCVGVIPATVSCVYSNPSSVKKLSHRLAYRST